MQSLLVPAERPSKMKGASAEARRQGAMRTKGGAIVFIDKGLAACVDSLLNRIDGSSRLHLLCTCLLSPACIAFTVSHD